MSHRNLIAPAYTPAIFTLNDIRVSRDFVPLVIEVERPRHCGEGHRSH